MKALEYAEQVGERSSPQHTIVQRLLRSLRRNAAEVINYGTEGGLI
jgi:hypothetical protein